MESFSIRIRHNDIVYAVRNKTHKTSKSSGLKDARIESNMQADDTPQDTRIVNDSMSKAIGNVMRELSKYISSTETSSEDFTIVTFTMPSTWRDTNKTGLVDDIYNYIVDFTVSEFFTFARNYDDAKQYMATAVAELANAKKKLYDKKSSI